MSFYIFFCLPNHIDATTHQSFDECEASAPNSINNWFFLSEHIHINSCEWNLPETSNGGLEK